MFEEIHPDDEAFKTLEQFCFKIGEGRIMHHKREVYYMSLYHPIDPNAMLLVHYDMMNKTIYIREATEGVSAFPPDELPLVHSFPVQQDRRPILPYAVDICKDEAIYYYIQAAPDTIPASMDTMSQKAPLDQYKRFTLLFDEMNPMPWAERQNPDGKLPLPPFPELP